MNSFPSIFNDVIGPIMRGPSSSHTAASWRIARICIEILNEPLKSVLVDFSKDGAWATNYREQGTVMGINGGLLGLDIVDDRMKNTESLAEEMGITINYEVNSFVTRHVNTVRLSLEGIKNKQVQVIAASLGGGSFEIQQINGSDINICGDYYELLILNKNKKTIPDNIKSLLIDNKDLLLSSSWNDEVIEFKSSEIISNKLIYKLKGTNLFEEVLVVNPVLPITSMKNPKLPFTTIAALLEYAEKENLALGDLGLVYEKSLSGLSESKLINKMRTIAEITLKSIEVGLQGTEYDDRILQQQSNLIENAEKKGKIFQNSLINNTIRFITAIMESKSAMEVIVANPTAGSCGTVGGVLKATADDLNANFNELVKAFFAAGIIGVYFAQGPGFSAEEHGCQVECGAASGMAAAGIVQLFGGTAKQSINAASMAIQNMIGLVCDPVGDRVEVPCLGKNISAAMNALSSATMAYSGFDPVIPLDEVIQTVSQVSKHMPTCVKCTGNGGLAVTPTSVEIKKKLLN
jgi:L-serine dehydratase